LNVPGGDLLWEVGGRAGPAPGLLGGGGAKPPPPPPLTWESKLASR